MANAPNAPIPATGAAQGAPPSPEAPPAQQPFALPDGMTAEAAHQRIHELQQDREFGQRWLASGNDSPEGRLMDALQHRALNQAQPEVKVVDENAEALKALGPPAKPADYRLDVRDPTTGFPLQIDAVERAVIDGVLLPAAHSLGLSQGDVAMIGDIVVKPMGAEQCEQTLRNIWRGDFEQGVKDFVDAMNAQPQIRELLLDDRYEMTLQNNAALIASIVSAFRRKQGRSR